jgi:hypothetical protein
MAWYSTGTVNVVNGSTTVNATGTSFIDNVDAGEALLAPDGKLYEIAAVTSMTSLTLASPYLGTTTNNQSYTIVPVAGYTRSLARNTGELVSNYSLAYANRVISVSGRTGDVTTAQLLTDLKTIDGSGSGLDADMLDGHDVTYFAPIASPALTGTPTAPTAAPGTSTTQLATTEFVETATVPATLLADIKTVDGSGSGLDADTVDGLHIGQSGVNYIPYVNANGNMGLGNSSPASKLDLGGTISSTETIRFSMGGNVAEVSSTGNGTANGLGNLSFNTRDGSAMQTRIKIAGSGNVLIGTTTDNGVDKLQVNGSISTSQQNGYVSECGGFLPIIGDTNSSFVGSAGSIATITDLNNLTRTGTYNGHDLTNAPTVGWLFVQHRQHSNPSSNAWAQQVVTTMGAGGNSANQVYIRTKVNGTWSQWYKIWHSGSGGSGSGLDADLLDGHDSTYFAPIASPALTGVPTAPTATSGTNTTQLATTSFVVGEKGGRRNYLINGNFDKWDYGTSQTTSGYGSANRWYHNNNGSTQTASQQVCGDTERALFNAMYYSRSVVSSVAGTWNLSSIQQLIENINLLAGKTVTLSFWAKADANRNIAVEFNQWFGTGGSPSSTVQGIGAQLVALTTSWQKKTITVTIPSIVGKTLGADGVQTTKTELVFWFDAGSGWNTVAANLGQQSGTFDIAQVRLEDGSVATNGWYPYDGEFGGEVEACERYLNKFTGLAGSFGAYAQGAYMSYQLNYTTMRAVPSIASSLSNVTYSNAEKLTLDTPTVNTARLSFDATAAATNASFTMGSGDYFMLSAEL